MAKFSLVFAAVGLLAVGSWANKRQAPPMGMGGGMCGLGGGGGGVTINVGGGGCCNCGCPAPPPPPPPGPGPTPDPWDQTTTDSWNVGTTGWMQPLPATTAAAGPVNMPIACPNDNDLVLVIDESGSIGSSNFQIVQDFAARLAEVWRSHPGNRVSVIFFENTARMYITLKESESLDGAAIRQKILTASYAAGGTSISTGVEAAAQELISNGRTNVPRNVVVLTDGVSYDPQNTYSAASNMFSAGQGINGFSVAVGANVDDSELMAVAQQDASHVFNVGDFNQLLAALLPVSQVICSATQAGVGGAASAAPAAAPAPAGVTPSSGALDMPIVCPTDNDLLLVIDESGSIGQSNFQIVLDFAARMAEVWRSHPGNRVSVIFFHDIARMEISLKDSETLDGPTIRQKILASNYIGGGTTIASGIDAATQELRTNGRLIEPRNVVVFTDGNSFDPAPTQTAATSMFSTGTSVNGYAVAVGTNTNDAELMAIAKQDASHIFKVGDFNQLLAALRPISQTICTATQTGPSLG